MRHASARRWFLVGVLLVTSGAAISSAAAQPDTRREDPDTAATRQYAAAVALQNREVYDLAAEEWSKFLDRFGDSPRADHARHYRAVCLAKLGRLQEAAKSFTELIRQSPDFPLLESTYLQLGVAQYRIAQQGDREFYDRAAGTMARLLRDFPKSEHRERALFYRAECLYAVGKKAEAADQYARLLADYADSDLAPDAIYALGVAQQELDRPDDARRTFAQYLKQYPDAALAPEVTLRLGETHFAAGQFDRASGYFAKVAAVKDFVLADHALMRQAACLYEQGDYAAATDQYAQLPRRFPESKHLGAAQLAAGKSAYLAGRSEEARTHLGPLLSGPDDRRNEAAHWIARSWLKDKRPADALRVVEAALAENRSESFAIELELDRADALYELPERRGEARKAYTTIARDHRDSQVAAEALYMASFAALAEGEYQGALEHTEQFARQFADSSFVPDVHYVAAEASLQAGDLKSAETRYRALIEESAGHADLPRWKLRLASVLQLRGAHRETISLVEPLARTLDTPADRAEASFLLGNSHAQLDAHDVAVRRFEDSLATMPEGSRAVDTLVRLAEAYRRLGKPREAKARLEQVLAQDAGGKVVVQAEIQLAELAADDADYDTAARRYRAVIERSDDRGILPVALAGLGWAQLNRGEHESAVRVLDELIRKFPEDASVPRARYARAVANYQRNEFEAARGDLEPLVRSDLPPDELADARYVLGLCQSELDLHKEAAATFRALLEGDENYAKADHVYYELAWALKSLGNDREAARTFGQLAEKHPQSPLAAEGLYHLGEHYYDAQKFNRAASSYYAAMRVAGKSALGEKAAHKLGWSYFRQEVFDKALDTFGYQRNAWPDGELTADAVFLTGECLFKQSKFDEALAAYRQLDRAADNQYAPLALLHAGQAAAQLDEWTQSGALLAELLDRFPDSPQAAEARYEHGWALQNLGQFDEATKQYGQVVASTDGELAARATFMIGEIYFQQKKHDLAVRSFFNVAYGYAYPKWQAAAHFEAGRCFEVLGKTDQARKSYQQVIDEFPESDQAADAQKRLNELEE